MSMTDLGTKRALLTAGLWAALGLTLTAVGQADAQGVPTPTASLGFEPGADFELATYEQSVSYFRELDEASEHLTLLKVGHTSEGRDWFMALVSAPDNLTNVERYREIAQRLAHPSGVTDDTARELAREGKAFVDISGGLHATEVAGAQHTIQLAYDLLAGAGTDPTVDEILDNVVIMLWPSLNPDGQTMVGEWYAANVGTSYEVAPLPALYQKYIGHDNNRDAYMLNQIESREVARTWRHWEPQIIYVHHQSAPFPTRIWVPPFAEPIASRSPPLVTRTLNALGMAIAQGLESRGMPGTTHMGTGFDAWYPGYIDYMPAMQNQAAFWTETALYRYATPRYYQADEFPEDRRALRVEALYTSPWEGGWWRLRDAVDYMRVASISVLEYAAKYKETLLYNRYQAGRNTIAKYRAEGPYAYFIPQEQHDPVAPVAMLRRLAFNGLRVEQLQRDVLYGAHYLEAGTWVIPMDQEFGELARQLLEVQVYPDLREFPEGPPEQPYDAAGWTLGYQMGVRVIEAAAPLPRDVVEAMTPVSGPVVSWTDTGNEAAPFDAVPGPGFDTDSTAAGIVPLPGRITGSGPSLAVDPAENNAFRAVNAAWATGAQVGFDEYGRYVITGASGGQPEAWAAELALQARRTESVGTPLPRPRIGLFRPWRPSMDEGWTRWLLERYGFELTNLRDPDVAAGGLRDRFDVIILPSERPQTLTDGFESGTVPPEYAGGLGPQGLRALDRFVRDGGTLVALNQSSDLAIDGLGLAVENAVAELDRGEFFTGGSIMEVHTDPAHPVMAGMPDRAAVFVQRSPVFEVQPGFQGRVLARYQDAGSPLMSGYLLGEQHLHGRSAALEVEHGEGRVILLGFRPQWRGQPYGTFRVLFNAALYHGAVVEEGRGSSAFAAPVAASAAR
jgi:hypothetical protein